MRVMQAKTGGSHLLIFLILLNLLSHKFCSLSEEEKKKVDSSWELIRQFGSLLKALVASLEQSSISDRLALCSELKSLIARHSKQHLAAYYLMLEAVLYSRFTPSVDSIEAASDVVFFNLLLAPCKELAEHHSQAKNPQKVAGLHPDREVQSDPQRAARQAQRSPVSHHSQERSQRPAGQD